MCFLSVSPPWSSVVVFGAYQSRSKPPVASSDHNVVHLIPTYVTKLKSSKPQEKVVRLWNSENKQALGACFDCTNWEVLREGTLDSACTVTTDYKNFCVESIIPTKTVKVYPINKVYITKDIKQSLNQKKAALKNKDTLELHRINKELRGKIRKAKDTHKRHLESMFKGGNSRKMWTSIKSMAGMPSKQLRPVVTNDELASAVELNNFFTRFETTGTGERSEKVLRPITVRPEDSVKLCRTAPCQPQLVLASSIRRNGGLPLSIINHGRFNHHLCTVSVVEFPETPKNITMPCLCS